MKRVVDLKKGGGNVVIHVHSIPLQKSAIAAV